MNRSGARTDATARSSRNRGVGREGSATNSRNGRDGSAGRNNSSGRGVSDIPANNRDGRAATNREGRNKDRAARNGRNRTGNNAGNRNRAGATTDANRNRRGTAERGNRAGANAARVDRNGRRNGARAGGRNDGLRRGRNGRLNGPVVPAARARRGNFRHFDRRGFRHRNDFYFHVGGYGFGFGYYGGWGYFANNYCWNPWWNWGYTSSFCLPYYWPHYRGFCYPYFWSGAFWPGYRNVVVDYVTYNDPYVSTVYLPAEGFDDDPFAADEVVIVDSAPAASSDRVTTSSSSEAPGPAVVPIVDGVDGGPSFDSARSLGDSLMRSNNPKQAAEAYRQAWIHDGTRDGLGRMSAALLSAGDYTLSSWAMLRQVGTDQGALLSQGVLFSELLGGPGLTKATNSLERYLVDNPNDEGSNLLLAALYIFEGREYAGYMILSRLDAAGFAPESTKLFLKRAESSLGR